MLPVPRVFKGFSRDALGLLRELEANNSYDWFGQHHWQFEELLVEPAIKLVMEIEPLLRQRFEPSPWASPRVGGSVVPQVRRSREHRDRPYWTHLELRFWYGQGPSQEHAGRFYVRIGADAITMGVGMPLFTPKLLERYRTAVDHGGSGRELANVLERYEAEGLRIGGQRLPRVPPPFADDHVRASLLRMLGLSAEHVDTLPSDAPEGPLNMYLPERLVEQFGALESLWHWLVELEPAVDAEDDG